MGNTASSRRRSVRRARPEVFARCRVSSRVRSLLLARATRRRARRSSQALAGRVRVISIAWCVVRGHGCVAFLLQPAGPWRRVSVGSRVWMCSWWMRGSKGSHSGLDCGAAARFWRAAAGVSAVRPPRRAARRRIRALRSARASGRTRPARRPAVIHVHLPVPRARLPLAPPSPRLRRPRPSASRTRAGRTALASRRCLYGLRVGDGAGRRGSGNLPTRCHGIVRRNLAASQTTVQRAGRPDSGAGDAQLLGRIPA
ncbi:hypothetical protein M2271_008380 [Streptomyces sp. LBL]|nr:hypothetical protein [Streptomyces sp. LBL]